MTTIKVGVREFRERISSFLESDTPVAVSLGAAKLSVSTFRHVESVLRQPIFPN